MEMSEEDKLAIKNALNGKLSDDYNELEKLLENLTTEKATTTNHGTFKRIDGAMSKVRMKMNKLKA
jgi:hypothetical protein